MNNLDTYTHLWNDNLPFIRTNQIHTDPHLHTLENDTRIGITLCCRPNQVTQQKVQSFLENSAVLEPKQYHYPKESLHTTVLSVITTGTTFNPKKLDIENYQVLIKEALQDLPVFSIEYKGVTVSSGAVMIQGFPTDETLESIRAVLREAFNKSPLFATIDARYLLHTAHMTCVRFKEPLNHPKKYAHFLEEWRNATFGKRTVEEIDLVQNDWYMREEKTKTLATFPLKKG